MTYRQSFGSHGENLAAELLRKKGYTIIMKNFRSKFGEIDIIAKDKGVIVFVEVKTRINRKYGTPEEAVTPIKLARIRKTIDYYMLLNKNTSLKQRIEVVALELNNNLLTSAKIIKVD